MYAWRTGQLKPQTQSSPNKNIKSKKNKGKGKTARESFTHDISEFTNIQQGCSDCGEAGAGQRLLTLLERSNA
ncbi:hypothetical protein B9K03_11965, partial [Rothia sp. Olga]